MIRKIYIFFILVLGTASLFAQQSPLYSQFILNEFIINPSVAGIDGMTSLNLSGRKQWFGWEYGPETYSACFSTRLLKSQNVVKRGDQGNKLRKGASGKVGLGAATILDRNGAVSRTTLNLTYSYHVFIQSSQLSFGLSFLAQQFKIDNELAKFRDDDQLQGLIGKSTYIPDAAFGMDISNLNYNLGVSVFQLFQSPVKFGNMQVSYKELKQVRTYYLHGSYCHSMRNNHDWEYEPSFVARATEYLQTSADLSIRFIYQRQYWAGLSFRTSKDFILLAGAKLNRFYFGYSFDYGFNEISRLSYGSHEIVMALKLGDSSRRYRYWERY
jgi:type IX secretion system PorP/SprF family membrane protein